MGLLLIAFLEEWEYIEKIVRTKDGLVYFFYFLRASIEEKLHLISPSQKRLQKLRFLQKLGCQKPYWDQTGLSSLVNEQVDPHPKPYSYLE